MAAAKEAAALERGVAAALERLGPMLEATKANVEKRAALTYEELQAELAEAEQVGALPCRPTQTGNFSGRKRQPPVDSSARLPCGCILAQVQDRIWFMMRPS